jgi:hypothetical protein
MFILIRDSDEARHTHMGYSAKKISRSNSHVHEEWVDNEIERRHIESGLQRFCARLAASLNNTYYTQHNLTISLTVNNRWKLSKLAKVQNIDIRSWRPKMNNLYPDVSEFLKSERN